MVRMHLRYAIIHSQRRKCDCSRRIVYKWGMHPHFPPHGLTACSDSSVYAIVCMLYQGLPPTATARRRLGTSRRIDQYYLHTPNVRTSEDHPLGNTRDPAYLHGRGRDRNSNSGSLGKLPVSCPLARQPAEGRRARPLRRWRSLCRSGSLSADTAVHTAVKAARTFSFAVPVSSSFISLGSRPGRSSVACALMKTCGGGGRPAHYYSYCQGTRYFPCYCAYIHITNELYKLNLHSHTYSMDIHPPPFVRLCGTYVGPESGDTVPVTSLSPIRPDIKILVPERDANEVCMTKRHNSIARRRSVRACRSSRTDLPDRARTVMRTFLFVFVAGKVDFC
jgi:hypothetical protein